MKAATYSLRVRLLGALALTLSLATLLQSLVVYRVALHEADNIADYHMIQIAHAVRRGIRAPVRSPEHDDLLGSGDRSFSLRITPTEEDKFDFQAAKEGKNQGFSTRTEGGRTLRVFTLEVLGKRIEVMHDMAMRSQHARSLAFRTVLPVLALALVLLGCLGWSIRRALRPLVASRNEIAGRAADDLRPLSIDKVPEELLPFITEINVLFARISKAFAAQQNFVAYAAHELRSPLAALRLQAQRLQRAESPDARDIAAERLMAGIDRATRMIEQVLVLAREEATGAALERTNLPTLARLALSDVFPLALARGVDLGADLADAEAEENYEIVGDVGALRVLLRNLLENAVKYAPAQQGVVNLVLTCEADSLVLRVEDNGPGIAADERERVFERFRRGRAHEADGCGLGLAIVKAIAERHRICITLDQSAPLGGLAVILRFPRA